MPDKETTSTLRERMESTTSILTDCAARLGVPQPVAEVATGKTPIDNLMAGFDDLESLGKAIENELARL